MVSGASLCPGAGNWPDSCYRKGSAGPSLTHKRLNSKQGKNIFIITSLDRDPFPAGLWIRKVQSHLCVPTCMSVHMCKDNQPQRSNRTATPKYNKALSLTSRKRQKQMIRESKKARETEIKRKNQGEDDFLSTKQQGQILVHLIGNISFVCKHCLEPTLISQIKAF